MLKGDREKTKDKKTAQMYLLTVIFCELIVEPGSLLRLEVSQHGGNYGADVF